MWLVNLCCRKNGQYLLKIFSEENYVTSEIQEFFFSVFFWSPRTTGDSCIIYCLVKFAKFKRTSTTRVVKYLNKGIGA